MRRRLSQHATRSFEAEALDTTRCGRNSCICDVMSYKRILNTYSVKRSYGAYSQSECIIFDGIGDVVSGLWERSLQSLTRSSKNGLRCVSQAKLSMLCAGHGSTPGASSPLAAVHP